MNIDISMTRFGYIMLHSVKVDIVKKKKQNDQWYVNSNYEEKKRNANQIFFTIPNYEFSIELQLK